MKLNGRHSRKTLPDTSDERALPPLRVGTLKPRKILVPVDFTECSQKAVTYAVSLAKHFRAGIILLHVARFSPAAASAPSGELVALQGDILNEEVRGDAARMISQWRDQITPHVPVRAMVAVEVSAHEEIVAVARQTNCDLIVIATHAKGALAHLFTGSVAEKVVHHAPCPVFVVREREHDFIQIRGRSRRPLVATL